MCVCVRACVCVCACMRMRACFCCAGYSGGNAGASHAGEGGTTSGASTVGAVYGDFRHPATVGSGGRLTQPGGALEIEATNVTVKGQLLSK